MRVDNLNLTGTTAAQTGRTQETEKSNRDPGAQTGAAATDKTNDRVELSSTLATLSRALSASGSERSSRVQALAAQYQSGNYHADSLATARGMVSDALSAESQ
jgi:anti-sigma28 factor (negative regulator of flagellin synthesis)